jgi:hypothetical protein
LANTPLRVFGEASKGTAQLLFSNISILHSVKSLFLENTTVQGNEMTNPKWDGIIKKIPMDSADVDEMNADISLWDIWDPKRLSSKELQNKTDRRNGHGDPKFREDAGHSNTMH